MQLQYHQELRVIQFHVLIVELFLLMVEYVDRIHEELEEKIDENIIAKRKIGTSCVISIISFDKSSIEIICFDKCFDIF